MGKPMHHEQEYSALCAAQLRQAIVNATRREANLFDDLKSEPTDWERAYYGSLEGK